MKALSGGIFALAGMLLAANAAAQVIFYEQANFSGPSFVTAKPVSDFVRHGFTDAVSSVVVLDDRWEVCEDARFRGRCVVLRPGRYPALASIGMDDHVSSVRKVSRHTRRGDDRHALVPVVVADRPAEREQRYEASVSSVRAVFGPAGQRCWVGYELALPDRSGIQFPATMADAVAACLFGQRGDAWNGSETAAATAERQASIEDVPPCRETDDQASPEYWDVTYRFRGREHRLQMTAPPGATVSVDAQGEPAL